MDKQTKEEWVKQAREGDIMAFHELFRTFRPQLKSYLYRLVTHRNDCEDLLQDTFLRSFQQLHRFRSQSSLKTWVFTIGTNLAKDHLSKRKRWKVRTHDLAKALSYDDIQIQQHLLHINATSPEGAYEVKEHIDYCFTCLAKTLPIEQQIALILKDIYAFKVKEIVEVMDLSTGVVKHLLIDARKTMRNIFDQRCALVSKEGVCNQCSELNGLFNPKQQAQIRYLQLEKAPGKMENRREKLYELRKELVRFIDPLAAKGSDLHEAFFQICERVNQ